MAAFSSDLAPIDLDEVTASDVVLLRPPMSLWGYNAQATEEALRAIARSVTARDVEIATLRREVTELRAGRDSGPPPGLDSGPPPGLDSGPPPGQDGGGGPDQPPAPAAGSDE
jgi:hypothetical protein